MKTTQTLLAAALALCALIPSARAADLMLSDELSVNDHQADWLPEGDRGGGFGRGGPGWGPGRPGHGPGHGGPGHGPGYPPPGGPGYPPPGGPGYPPAPPPPPSYGFLCQGTFYGSFANGRQVAFTLQPTGYNGVAVNIQIGPGEVYFAQGGCQQYGNQAQIYFTIVNGPAITHRGQIIADYNGGAVLQGGQDGGFAFSAVRR